MRRARTVVALTASAALPLAGALGMATTAHAAATAFPSQYAAPYLQVTSGDVGDLSADMKASGNKFYTLAFLTPKSGCTPEFEGGPDSWNAFTSQVNSLKSAGGNVIISFGGESGGEIAQTCTSVSSLETAYANVASTYGITRLDFDIEGSTLDDTTSNARRNQALAALQKANPSIQIDFTVPVDPSGLESNVVNMLKDAKSKGVKVNLVNIMVMDFGDGQNALADGESAANGTAAQLASIFGVSSSAAWHMLGLTPIAGVNDDNENFTQSNASSLESFADSHNVQELAFWEVDGYDAPLGYAYTKIFTKITSSGSSPTPTPTPTPTAGTGNTYVGAASGKCIDDPNSSTTNATQMEIWTCNGGANQSLVASNGTLQVEGKCLNASGAGTANNTPIIIYTCGSVANEQFSYNASNGTIVGSQSGKCITVLGAATTDGSKLILYTCNGGTNQKWTRQ